jgi:hypothetical protein
MTDPLHYISILAGGRCAFECSFCVGRGRKEGPEPHFGPGVLDFIQQHAGRTRWLSISGSTSDPLFVAWNGPDRLRDIIYLALSSGLQVSLHTRVISRRSLMLSHQAHELCVSLDPQDPDLHQKARDLASAGCPVRISAVATSANLHLFADPALYELLPYPWTIRRNVREPDLPEVPVPFIRTGETLFGCPVYAEQIAVWDFEVANQHINALYLWPDGQIRRQCFWEVLY